VALFTASVAALLSTRVSGYRVAYQLNGLIVLPVVLLLIPATAFLFLFTGAALAYIAALVAPMEGLESDKHPFCVGAGRAYHP
jgi:hypothetical protein